MSRTAYFLLSKMAQQAARLFDKVAEAEDKAEQDKLRSLAVGLLERLMEHVKDEEVSKP